FQARRYSECIRCGAGHRGWSRAVGDLLVMFPRRWLCRRAGINVVVSHDTGRRLGLPRSTTIYHRFTMPSGTPTTPPAALPATGAGRSARPACFAYVGRLVPEKGVALLLRAAAQVTAGRYACRLKVIGDGPERGALEGLARQLGIERQVEFTGFLSRSEM